MDGYKKALADMAAAFERGTRTNGDQFWRTREGTVDWIFDACYAAHGDKAPNDITYDYIIAALDLLEAYDCEPDAASDAIEADIYTSDLTAWLASSVKRVAYIDAYLEEFGPTSSIIDAMQGGQLEERREVFAAVWAAIHERAESLASKVGGR